MGCHPSRPRSRVRSTRGVRYPVCTDRGWTIVVGNRRIWVTTFAVRGRGLAKILAGSLAGVACALVAPALASAELTAFGHACSAQNGVRFCPTATLAQRVPSFDGVPLDVDVTLPPKGIGPFPTI